MKVAGPWTLDLETMLWTNAMSSTTAPSGATQSLTHFPDWPYCRQPHGEASVLPGLDWKSSTFSPGSQGLPWSRMRRGL
jgi:hypothetical protein